MKSHLTRRVFRRLLLSQPVVQHREIHCQSTFRPTAQHGRITVSRVPTRTFFNLFQQPQQRDIREPILDPGMEKMLELDKRIHLKARLPPPQDLARAFKAFIQAKQAKNQIVEDFHATQLLQTLRAIDDAEKEAGERCLEAHDLKVALRLLSDQATDATRVHNALARTIFRMLEDHNDITSMEPEARQIILTRYIRILCRSGDSLEARQVLERLDDSVGSNKFGPWTCIVEGLAREDKEDDLLRTLDFMKARGIAFNSNIVRIMTMYCAQKDDVQQAKDWFQASIFEPVEDEEIFKQPYDHVFRVLLEFCLRNDEMAWGQSALTTKGELGYQQETFDAIFRAAATTGRSVDEIDNMLNVMYQRAKEEGANRRKPNIETFNGLIRFALSRNDAYTAERYYALAEKWNVAPNAESYILQVEYRLAAGDISGAQTAYSKLRDEPVRNDEDWPIMNRLLCTLVQQPEVNENAIYSLIEDITERKRTFPGSTILALCNFHLQRDEYFELVDLLQTYAYQYSTLDRIRIRDALVEFTLDPNTDAGRAWDTYMIFHQIFDLETRRDIRNKVMTLMFDHGRPDLASHVFTKMSKHVRADTQPDTDTYVRAFEGIAKTEDTEVLEVIHNLLKLDTEVEPSTRLYNALMLAYTACGVPWRALEFWDQIATSDEGPSYESLHIAFRACERAPFGYRKAKVIWERLRQTDAEITRELFASYVACLAGQRLHDDMVEEIKRMPQVVVDGKGPDLFTIGSIYNATMGLMNQDRVVQWTQQEYPGLWDQLETQGFDENEMGMRFAVGIDRSLRA